VSVEGMNKAEVERGGERSGRLRSILHMIVQGMQKQKPPSPHCKGQASVSCNRKKGKRRGGEAKKTTVRLWKEGATTPQPQSFRLIALRRTLLLRLSNLTVEADRVQSLLLLLRLEGSGKGVLRERRVGCGHCDCLRELKWSANGGD
jgi:hypothetical protein